ncbi:hypothetical protein PAAG_12286 [Paracoccidioides lutzii Pb01]|uniref:Uncharacterized protein n=1 Tax=Paracoccidioides lutzii (strain ATCC MYA-826 / Pb01) TaxID=502779 RepID=A0A0A2V4F6_PARBA|nr:hypothetical protein PAAG_12286 [Paracoccidioides lutzii Pb01]KGQ01035.1 hypothetical protein PAAG_12286 [Paracoccidioides lutzii Pb01]
MSSASRSLPDTVKIIVMGQCHFRSEIFSNQPSSFNHAVSAKDIIAKVFLCQYLLQYWDDTYDPTTSGTYCKQTVVDGKVVLVDVLNLSLGICSRKDEFGPVIHQYAKSSDGFIFLYDVTSREGLSCILEIHEAFLRHTRSASTFDCCLGPPLPLYVQSTKRLYQLESSKTLKQFTCFPRLPHELQLAVLRAALVSSDPVVLPTPHINGININILKVCKLFHEEGTRIFWKENIFTFWKPFCIVAETAFVTPAKSRAVTTEEGQELAYRLGCNFVELSSKSYGDVENVFTGLIRKHRSRIAEVSRPSGYMPRGQNLVRIAHVRALIRAIRSLVRTFKQRTSRIFT